MFDNLNQQGKAATKLNDPRSFSFPCMIGSFSIDRGLANLEAIINITSYNMCKKPGLGELTPTRMIHIATHSSAQSSDRNNQRAPELPGVPNGIVTDGTTVSQKQ
ncbi:hypothetical protein M9H77_26865 [Catharanthus roseus]|uniref:Uncharacterized protein n=1 Tax=Catharanthus roseus TaxID=4058 RepID=A0ACC0ACB8_CATRO|nr:hypothetical protein M9H77_26865 [Catharanthus roseus]